MIIMNMGNFLSSGQLCKSIKETKWNIFLSAPNVRSPKKFDVLGNSISSWIFPDVHDLCGVFKKKFRTHLLWLWIRCLWEVETVWMWSIFIYYFWESLLKPRTYISHSLYMIYLNKYPHIWLHNCYIFSQDVISILLCVLPQSVASLCTYWVMLLSCCIMSKDSRSKDFILQTAQWSLSLCPQNWEECSVW
jgi:hypothetical protein